MNISEKLTGQQLEEILKGIYEMAHNSQSLQAKDLIMEIKQSIISVVELQR